MNYRLNRKSIFLNIDTFKNNFKIFFVNNRSDFAFSCIVTKTCNSSDLFWTYARSPESRVVQGAIYCTFL